MVASTPITCPRFKALSLILPIKLNIKSQWSILYILIISGPQRVKITQIS